MPVTRSNPPGVAAPIGRYSHVAIVPADYATVHVSGQIGADASGALAGPDAMVQTRQAFANIEAILHALGATPADLVKLFTLLVGGEQLAGFRTARDEVLDRWYPHGDAPAHSLAIVSALAAPELLVEIEAVVAIPEARDAGA
jgi:enamine deaminase RidA (YjgF/YER057c/UK114 family)